MWGHLEANVPMFLGQSTTEAGSAEVASAAGGDETRGARGAGLAPSPAGRPNAAAATAEASLLQKLLSQ